ncbi:MAG: MFS transporter [Anaerolineales bacterium]|jgi:MFS family permease
MENLRKISARIIAALFTAQSLTSAGTAAMAAVLAIVAVELSGKASWAGVPNSLLQLAAAGSAFWFGYLWERIGRRYGIALGLGMGAVGLYFMFTAVQSGNFWVLLAGVIGAGFARSAMQLARFTAADISPPDQRGRAISYVVLGGTVGAVAGPLIADPANNFGKSLGFAEWSGPIGAAALLFAVAALVVYLGLQPEPSQIANQMDTLYPEKEEAERNIRGLLEIMRQPAVLTATVTMAVSQMVMIMVMGITSLHMKVLSHELGAISRVFSAHMIGMFAFSIFTGQLADRWGRVPVILTGIGVLMASFILAPMFPTALMLGISLYLLGLGWNLCFVGGSALLSDQLTRGERARTQGFNDLFLGLASALGSLVAGWIFDGGGYGALNATAAVLTLLPLVLLGWWFMMKRRAVSVGLD